MNDELSFRSNTAIKLKVFTLEFILYNEHTFEQLSYDYEKDNFNRS